jgi:hypothetical protein
LARGRALLAKRLARRGVTMSAAALAASLAQKAAAGVPAALLSATIKVVTLVGAEQRMHLAAGAAILMKGVLRAMFISKLKKIAVGLLVLGIVALGGGVLQRLAVGQETTVERDAARAKQPSAAARKLSLGDSAPETVDKPKPTTGTNKPTPDSQGDNKAEISALVAEIAKLRLELKSAVEDIKKLEESVKTSLGTMPKRKSPFYRGRPASFWLEQFEDADPVLRVEAMEALGYLALKDNKLIAVLVTGLKDTDSDVGTKASLGLGRLPEATPALLELLKKETSADVLRLAVVAVGNIGPPAKVAVPALSKMLKMKECNVNEGAAIALGAIGPEAKSAIPFLIGALGDYISDVENRKKREGIQALKSGQDSTQGGEFGQGSFPSTLRWAIESIEPQLKGILPNDVEVRPNDDRPSEPTKMWRAGHDALKKKYQNSK